MVVHAAGQLPRRGRRLQQCVIGAITSPSSRQQLQRFLIGRGQGDGDAGATRARRKCAATCDHGDASGRTCAMPLAATIHTVTARQHTMTAIRIQRGVVGWGGMGALAVLWVGPHLKGAPLITSDIHYQ